MLFSRFRTFLCALVTVNTVYTIYFFLIHHCTNSLSSLHIFVHHCTFCALLHTKTSPDYAHTNHRFKQLGILKFQQINRYLRGIFMYKAINKLLPIMFQSFFVRRDEEYDHYTRASWNLSVQYARTNYRRFSLFCKGPIIWNEIPSSISKVTMLGTFKKIWKQFLISQE